MDHLTSSPYALAAFHAVLVRLRKASSILEAYSRASTASMRRNTRVQPQP
jgi:hypothetical protein